MSTLSCGAGLPNSRELANKKDVINEKTITNANSGEQVFSIVKHCIHEVHDGDKIYNRIDITDKDIEEFMDSMNTEQLQMVLDFFQTMPKIRHPVIVTNPKTKVQSEVVIEGMNSFLA